MMDEMYTELQCTVIWRSGHLEEWKLREYWSGIL